MEDYKFVGPYLTLSIEGLHDTVLPTFKLLQKDLESAADKAAQAGAKAGAKHAKTNHKFKTRSGELEGSIGWSKLVTDGTEPRSEFFAKAEHALYVDKGTKAHPIDPKPGNPTGLLWWNDPKPDGPLRHAAHVEHPGTKPDEFMDAASIFAGAETQAQLESMVDAACEKADRSLR